LAKGRFDGKLILVTGGASGIGKACAERFSQEGGQLLLADLNADGACKVAAELTKAFGAEAMALGFDAADPRACRSMVEKGVSELGKLDVLCNIAGIMDWGHFMDFPGESWERMMRVNLSSVFYVTQAAMPHLIATKGNVVNMASAAGLMGIAYTTAYCTTKAGVVALTKSIAVEFASRGVRINAVCPGGVKTPMHYNTTTPEGLDQKLIDRLYPKMGDLCDAEDIAAAVAYLASAEARYVTGVVLAVDGGQTAG